MTQEGSATGFVGINLTDELRRTPEAGPTTRGHAVAGITQSATPDGSAFVAFATP